MLSKDIEGLEPGGIYNIKLTPVDGNGPSSLVLQITVPKTDPDGGGPITASNSITTVNYSDTGAIVLGGTGPNFNFGSGISTPSGTLFLNAKGILAYNIFGYPTVTISSTTGNASFGGTIFANSGYIGGDANGTDTNAWRINSGSLTSGTGGTAVGITTGTYAFYAGNSNPTLAPFSVTNTGNLYAQNASIAGAITATSGSIGGFAIGGNSLYATNISLSSVNGFALGPTNQFTVDTSGNMKSTSGSIGGWVVAGSEIYSNPIGPTHIALNSNPSNPKIYVGYGNHGSLDTGFYADSAGRFSLSNQLIFNPALGVSGASVITGTVTTTTYNSYSSTNDFQYSVITGLNNSSSFIQPNMSITSGSLAQNTYVVAISGTTGNDSASISPPAILAGTGSFTFQFSDLADLTVAGRITGVINSVKPVPPLRIGTTLVTASVNTTASVVSFSTTGHAFNQWDRLIFEGLPVTNNLNQLNYAASAGNVYQISTASNSVNFDIFYVGNNVTLTSTTGVSISGSVSVQEMTLGLHSQESFPTGSSSAYYHSAGIGIRLDKYNWWFTNNQFRVGTDGSYFKWDGSQFKIQGGSNKSIILQVGANDAANVIAIASGSPIYSSSNTPFYVDGTGSFSLGQVFKWDGSNLNITGNSTFSGNISGGTLDIGGTGLTDYRVQIGSNGQLVLNSDFANSALKVRYGQSDSARLDVTPATITFYNTSDGQARGIQTSGIGTILYIASNSGINFTNRVGSSPTVYASIYSTGMDVNIPFNAQSITSNTNVTLGSTGVFVGNYLYGLTMLRLRPNTGTGSSAYGVELTAGNDFVPESDNASYLGTITPTRRWRNVCAYAADIAGQMASNSVYTAALQVNGTSNTQAIAATGAISTTSTITATGNVTGNIIVATGNVFTSDASSQNVLRSNNNNATNQIVINPAPTDRNSIYSHWFPGSNNTYFIGGTVGSASYAWKSMLSYAYYTISDKRLKTDFVSLSSDPLGIDLIRILRPVRYRWIDGGNEHVVDSDGNWVTDENGWVWKQREGVRNHTGFLAQEVKSAIDSLGMDWAAWCLSNLNDESSNQFLHYEEFIAPLVAAAQNIDSRLITLEDNYNNVIPSLLKNLQDQSEQIQQLSASIVALAARLA